MMRFVPRWKDVKSRSWYDSRDRHELHVKETGNDSELY